MQPSFSRWNGFDAPCPREVVCDASHALLITAVRSFTGYLTLEEYSNACKGNILPVCYTSIRIDVAHFVKIYANFLKDARPRVKAFYLSLLGQLILSSSINRAEEILKGILIITKSETESMTTNDKKTICEIYKIKIKNLLTSNEKILIDYLKQSDNVYDDDEDSDNNKWNQCKRLCRQCERMWAKDIDNEIQQKIFDNEGDLENAHYVPTFA